MISGSNGWLESFRSRHNITFNVVSGERGSVDLDVVDDWKQTLAGICADYSPEDIWNLDETGIVYRALPDRTLVVKGSDCAGGKQAKERLTAALACSMAGEFYTPLVIGKSAKPHCFRNLNPATQLPVKWAFNKKAWMTTEIFMTWLEGFNKTMRARKRKVLLFVDNAPSHPHNHPLMSHVKLVFLPANTTSVLQPLDQGIIQAMKLQYRKRVVSKILAEIDKDVEASKLAKTITVLDAVHWIGDSVKAIRPSTVTKCFAKAGFPVTTDAHDDDADDDMPLSQLLATLHSRVEHQHVVTDATEYANVDSDIPTSDDLSGDWEKSLVANFLSDKAETDSADEEDHQIKETISHRDAIDMTVKIKDYCIAQGLDLWQTFADAENQLLQNAVRVRDSGRQTTMDSFFVKK